MQSRIECPTLWILITQIFPVRIFQCVKVIVKYGGIVVHDSLGHSLDIVEDAGAIFVCLGEISRDGVLAVALDGCDLVEMDIF
jgi:hypothetical protein